MVHGLRDDDRVDQDAGDPHLARAQRPVLGDPLDLHDHHAAGVLGRLRHRQHLEGERLPLHGDVALGVGRRPAQQGHVHRLRGEEQVLLPAQRHQLDQFLRGALVHPAAPVARIDERAEPDLGHHARAPAGDLPEQVTDHTLRPAVRLDAVVECQHAEARHEPPVPADDPAHHAVGPEVVQPARAAVALARRVDQGEVPRRAGGLEPPFQRERQLLGEPDADEAAGGDGVAVEDDLRRGVGRDDLVALHRTAGLSAGRRRPTPDRRRGPASGRCARSPG